MVTQDRQLQENPWHTSNRLVSKIGDHDVTDGHFFERRKSHLRDRSLWRGPKAQRSGLVDSGRSGRVAGVIVGGSDQNTEAVLHVDFRVALVHLQGLTKDLFSVMLLSFFHRAILTHLLVMGKYGFSMDLLTFIQSDPAFRELVAGE